MCSTLPNSLAQQMQRDHPAWTGLAGLLLESAGEGIFGIDLEGRCTFINAAGARMLGYEVADVLGHNMHELTHHSHADGTPYPDRDCPIFNAFRRGLACRVETEVFWRRNREPFPVEYSSHPILDGSVVLGAVITFVDITDRKRASAALEEANRQLERRVAQRTGELSAALARLRELTAYLDSVREEERTRIAREVHDELGSLLVALKMDVNWLDRRLGEQQARDAAAAQAMRQQMRAKCGNMSRLIEDAVESVGRIITDLRPSILDHQGLWAAIEWQAHEFTQAAELRLDWDVDGQPLPPLPNGAATAVFRIFQEILSNIGRHAQAQAIQVRIFHSGEELVLRVRDDGCGAHLDVFEDASAYGVMGMRERARHLGGRLDIQSRPGAGCAIELRMPINHG